jgi:hypothetical protein
MRRSAALLAAACLLAEVGCSKEEEKKDEAKGVAGEPAAGAADDAVKEAAPAAPAQPAASGDAVDPESLADKIGVEPGPIEYDKDEGAAAVVASARGVVEVRRVGNETWEETKAEAQLHAGDQVRAADGGQVNVTLVDETAIEVAEQSAIAIGSRDATADPASSAAVLYGVARFSVADRAPGEGPFLVFTPGGVVATKGTVYTVGVAASGVTRVGVEEGEVEVAGSARLDAPVALAAGKVLLVEADGDVGAPAPAGDVDWGAWRDDAEARLEVKAAADYHAKRAAALEVELAAAYAELETQTAAAAEAEADIEAAEQADSTEAYEAAAPDMGGAVDASFALSLRLQYLSNAMLGHAYVADALYVRHPDAVAVIEPVRPRLAGAVLWNKKYHAVADLHVQPLRAHYYYHHPVGRAHARLVAYPIPPFYARVKLGYEPPRVSSRVKVHVYRPPIVRPSVRVRRTVFWRAPRVGWYAGVKARVRPAPARAHWYVRPRAPRARVVFGARPSASVRVKTVFRAAPPRPRAKAVVRFGAGVGVRDHRRGVEVRDHRRDVDLRGRGAVRGAAGVKIKAGVGAPAVEVRDHRSSVRGAAGVRVKAGGRGAPEVRDHRTRTEVRGRGQGSAGASARVKVKAPKVKPPKVKVKPPRAKASVKVKGGIKLGD